MINYFEIAKEITKLYAKILEATDKACRICKKPATVNYNNGMSIIPLCSNCAIKQKK